MIKRNSMRQNKKNSKNKYRDPLVNNKHFNHKKLQKQVLLKNSYLYKNKKLLVQNSKTTMKFSLVKSIFVDSYTNFHKILQLVKFFQLK